MRHFFVIKGAVFGIKKLTLDEIYQISSSTVYWQTIPLFFVNITENGFLTFPKDFEFDVLSFCVVLLNFFYVNGVAMYLYAGGADAKSQLVISPQNIVINYPDTEDITTKKFRYEDILNDTPIAQVVMLSLKSTPENNLYLLKEITHPQYTVYYSDGSRKEEIKYHLPTLVKDALRIFIENINKKTTKDALKDMFKFWFVYSQKAHAFPPKTILPEDVPHITSVLTEFLKKEKEEYEKLERERKKYEPKS